MNFFQAQDRARRNTLLLVILFTAAVALTIALLYYGLLFVIHHHSDGSDILGAQPGAPWHTYNKDLLTNTSIGVLTLVFLGSLAKMLALSGGGKKVAEALGGRLVLPATRDPAERQLMNIVEEMAIAAGAPIPDVYLLPDQHINAFAAGTKPSNAAIGVTRGCMTLLNREQLQGVIAHEFSHIMNGDMRLNIRLIAIINGLMLIGYIGYFFVRSAFYSSALSSSRDNNRGGAPIFALVGLALIVAGFVGTFFGSWIRAAVSRQREFLADAAAVQYTRQSTGIAGALERIGELSARGAGGEVHGASGFASMFQDKDSIGNHHAIEYSHMFFSNAVHVGFANPFASHPPLQQRIARLMPGWSAENPINTAPLPAAKPYELPRKQKPTQAAAASAAAYSGLFDNRASAGIAAGFAASAVTKEIGTLNAASIAQATKIVENIPPVFARAAEDPYTARALIYTMLLDRKNEDIRNNQLAHLHQHADTGIFDMTKALMPNLTVLRPAAKLPLVQLTLPALRQLSKQQYQLFLNNMAALIAADQSIELFEWCIQGILVHSLHEHFHPNHRRLRGNRSEAMAYALSILAKISQPQPTAAFSHAIQQAGLQLTYIDDNFDPQRLFDSLQILSTAAPKQKEQFTRAAAECAAFNGKIDANEAALLRAYFMIIDCPLPLQVAQAA